MTTRFIILNTFVLSRTLLLASHHLNSCTYWFPARRTFDWLFSGSTSCLVTANELKFLHFIILVRL